MACSHPLLTTYSSVRVALHRSSPFTSTVPRFPAFKEPSGRVLGPDTYKPSDPAHPLIIVHDQSKKSSVFRSATSQRSKFVSERTADFVAPGSYNPSYEYIRPEVGFAGRKSSAFASQCERFAAKPGVIDTPDSNWKMDTDAKDRSCQGFCTGDMASPGPFLRAL